MNQGAKPIYDLEERTFQFAKGVRLFVKQLPKTIANVWSFISFQRSSGTQENIVCYYWQIKLVWLDVFILIIFQSISIQDNSSQFDTLSACNLYFAFCYLFVFHNLNFVIYLLFRIYIL